MLNIFTKTAATIPFILISLAAARLSVISCLSLSSFVVFFKSSLPQLKRKLIGKRIPRQTENTLLKVGKMEEQDFRIEMLEIKLCAMLECS